MIHRQTHPDLDVAGCFGCKISSVRFGTVPGGAKDRRNNITRERRTEKGLNRYRELKQAGEQPSGTSLEAQEKDKYKQELWEKHGPSIQDENPPEKAAEVKANLLNGME